VDGPREADPLTLNVSALCELVLVGLKDAVTPSGRPLAVKATLPENPPMEFTLTVVDPLAFCCKATAAGADESVTPGACRVRDEDPTLPQPVISKIAIEIIKISETPAPED
jgi:hypothetical protein